MKNTWLENIGKFTTAEVFYKKLHELRKYNKEKNLPVSIFPTFEKDESAIEFRNFSLRYGENPATLYKTQIQIPKRKIVAIIGPSGCGKSSFLRSINRMNEEIATVETNGEVILDGKNIYDPLTDVLFVRTLVGMIFQKPQPFPRSIYNNVSFGPKMHGIKRKESLDKIVEKSLKSVGLFEEVKHRLENHAYELSGGQQQRLCIARAIAVNPKVLLCDEPASALDPTSTFQIEDLLTELKQKYTVVIVTHNMQQAARLSDYCFLMYNGVIVEYGKTKQIFENPVNELTESYISGRFG